MIPDSVLESAVSVYLRCISLDQLGYRWRCRHAGTVRDRILYRMADVGRPTSPIISVTVTN
jgi:hypothetical protein